MEEPRKNPGKPANPEKPSRFPRKYAPDNFRRYPPEIARVLAHKAKEVFAANQDFTPTSASRCQICTHNDREEIDHLILTGSGLSDLRAALGLVGPEGYKWTAGRFRHHRDNHLLPLIATEVAPAVQAMRALPYPKDGTEDELIWWYFFQNYALYGEALENKNGSLAARVLREMREIDFGYRIIKTRGPIEIEATPQKQPESAPPMISHAAPNKLELALQRSRIHNAEYKPGDTDETSGEI